MERVKSYKVSNRSFNVFNIQPHLPLDTLYQIFMYFIKLTFIVRMVLLQ